MKSNIIVTRSVPLSAETRAAWNSAGAQFVRRSNQNQEAFGRVLSRMGGRPVVVNLGCLDIVFGEFDCRVFNSPALIRAVSHPKAARQTLDKFLPPNKLPGPHWHKFGGFGGQGVRFHDGTGPDCQVNSEVQQHIEGTEYRVITVGEVVVQASRKVNVEWVNGKHNFDYEWCGVEGIRTSGIIPFLKEAVSSVRDAADSVLGWDVIVADRPYIIECNTSPGVNEATAKRIVSQIERMIS